MISFDVCQCGAPLQRMERPTPKPAGTEVLLKMLAAGVCHSDLHIWEGFYEMGGGKRIQLLDRGIKLPLTMGHEIVGEVVALGPGAKGVKVGDKRLVYPWIGCGACKVCQSGEEQLCLAPKFLGVFANGGYSDHVLVPHARYLLDFGNLPADRVAPLACSGVTTYGALKKLGATLTREPLVIIGAGGLGLMCLALAKAMGSPGAIVVDIDDAKRDAAMQAGAKATVDGKAADAAKQIMKLTDGGAWSVIDLVGSSSSVRMGIDCLTKGGHLVVVGLFGGDVTISTPLFPLKAMTIQGSYVGSVAELKELLELVKRTGLPTLPVATRPLPQADSALGELRSGKVIGRLVLTP
jgi:D-arabinose 1-dehydrogenase-like Zn-dependent alcohol dehydrogenase